MSHIILSMLKSFIRYIRAFGGQKCSGLPHYRPHDLRYTYFTWRTELDYSDLSITAGIKIHIRDKGMIADYYAAVNMFRYMIKKTWGKTLFSKPHIVVFMPKDMTKVEKRALEDVMYELGAKELTISNVPLERFRDDMSYDLYIAITKDEPEKYIAEELSHILNYAAQEQIPAARVEELLKAQCG